MDDPATLHVLLQPKDGKTDDEWADEKVHATTTVGGGMEEAMGMPGAVRERACWFHLSLKTKTTNQDGPRDGV